MVIKRVKGNIIQSGLLYMWSCQKHSGLQWSKHPMGSLSSLTSCVGPCLRHTWWAAGGRARQRWYQRLLPLRDGPYPMLQILPSPEWTLLDWLESHHTESNVPSEYTQLKSALQVVFQHALCEQHTKIWYIIIPSLKIFLQLLPWWLLLWQPWFNIV